MSALAWLQDYLSTGPMETSEVMAAAKAAGYKKAEIHEAKTVLGVRVTNDREGNRPPRKWFWSLPEAKE